jgi:hypothetical protein
MRCVHGGVSSFERGRDEQVLLCDNCISRQSEVNGRLLQCRILGGGVENAKTDKTKHGDSN